MCLSAVKVSYTIAVYLSAHLMATWRIKCETSKQYYFYWGISIPAFILSLAFPQPNVQCTYVIFQLTNFLNLKNLYSRISTFQPQLTVCKYPTTHSRSACIIFLSCLWCTETLLFAFPHCGMHNLKWLFFFLINWPLWGSVFTACLASLGMFHGPSKMAVRLCPTLHPPSLWLFEH